MEPQEIELDVLQQNIPIRVQPFDFDTLNSLTDGEIQQWLDSRGFTLLMVAAENGEREAVDHIIDRGEDLDYEVEGQTAASLAFTNGHHEIVLSLIKANAKYPNNYNQEKASDELKAFVNLSQQMHEKVRNCDEDNEEIFGETEGVIRANCERFPTMRHFYDTENNSLLKTTMINAMFEIYKILLTLNIFLGNNESVDDIIRQLDDDNKEDIRRINAELSTNLFTDEMMILMRNCKLGPGVTDHGYYIEFIRKAFDFLFKIPSIEWILKIVAARREFKIIFDFKRNSIQFLDPFQEPYTNGIFYTAGRLYIGAMDMLDPDNAHKVYAVMAHELCHFAMFLTFDNMANPYRENESLIESDFQQITQECQVVMENEPIVHWVFVCYPPEMYHAELIVRAPQMIVTYFYNHEILAEMRQTFPTLFDFFEVNVVNEMVRELPRLQEKYHPDREIKEKNKKLKLRIKILIACLIMSIPLAAAAIFYVYTPSYSWSTLGDEEKFQFKNATVNFYGVDVKFGELFADDSEVYDLLSSEQIKYGLDGNSEGLSKAISSTYKPKIFLTYSNMTENLRNKFIRQSFNFQGRTIEVRKLLTKFDALNFLTPIEVLQMFEAPSINISFATDIKTSFLVERFFINENIEIKNSLHYDESGEINTMNAEIKNTSDVLKEIIDSKTFVLSDIAGEGKSTSFRNFWVELKRMFPDYWIQFVDLKRYTEVYKKSEKINLRNPEELLTFLTSKLLNLNELESEIFNQLYSSGRIIFLWDGIDEISPLYKNFVLSLTLTIKISSENSQLISTRPQYLKDFEKNFQVKAYKFMPIRKSSRVEFFIKAFATDIMYTNVTVFLETTKVLLNGTFGNYFTLKSNLNHTDFYNKNEKVFVLLEKAQIILESIEASDYKKKLISNPLLLRMISEILNDESFNENFEVNSNLNFYTIYETFIEKKLEITREKGKIVGKDLDKILLSSTLNLMQVHQAYALKQIYGDFLEFHTFWEKFSISNLTIMTSISKLSGTQPTQISRFGILEVNSGVDFSFVHRTFAEFLIAKFLIDNFENFDLTRSEIDSELKIFLLNSVLFSGNFEFIKTFLLSYKDIRDDNPGVYEFLKDFSLEGFAIQFENNIKNYSLLPNFENLIKNFTTSNQVNILNFYHQVKNKLEQDSKINRDSIRDNILLKNYFDNFKMTVFHEIFSAQKNFKYVEIATELCDEFLTPSEIEKLLLQQETFLDFTSLIYGVYKLKLSNLKIFWKFIDKNLSGEAKRKLLLLESQTLMTPLQTSMWSKDPTSFRFVTEIYGRQFNDNKLREVLLKIHENFLPFVDKVVREASYETALEVSKYLQTLFKNHKIELRKLLSHRDTNGDSIYSFFKDRNEFGANLAVLKELFGKTFDENDQEKIAEELQKLFLKSAPKKSSNAQQSMLHDLNFLSVVINQLKNDDPNLRESLLRRSSRNGTFMHDYFVFTPNEPAKLFVDKIQDVLTKSEITELLFALENEFNETSLMRAAKWRKLKDLSVFWEFIDNILTEDDKKKLLAFEQKNFAVALHYPMWNEDPSPFLYLKKIYEDKFTTQELQKMFTNIQKDDLPFVFFIIKDASPKTASEVSTFLEKLFIDKKEELRSILSHRNKDGESVFSWFKDKKGFEEKMKIFVELLRKTFDESQEEEFRKCFNALIIKQKFV